MKAIWITDLHLRPIRQEAGEKLLAFISSQVETIKPDIVICTGDVFHDKNYMYGTMIELFREFLTKISAQCPIYVIPGNHDYGVEYSVHSLSGYKGMPNVHIVDTTCRITDKVGIVSYARQEARFQALMQELGPVEFLFGHFDLNGFDLGSGWEEKESWSDPAVFQSVSGLKIVFSGHYHLKQEKVIDGIRYVYLGTGATTDFGESDQQKRIGLVDLETGELTDIPTGLTLHKTLRINAGDAFPDIPGDEVKTGVEYRLVIKGTQQQIALIDKPRDYQARITYDFVTEVSERLDVTSTESKEDVLKKYVQFEYKKQGKSLENSELDRERLMGTAQSIYQKLGGANMRFKDLIAECAYSYEYLHVEEKQFNSGGLTAIIGKNKDQDTANGAGKSNILKIIYYLLFGKELNGAPIEEISNRAFGRGHFGQLIFEDKGNEFKIQRYVDFKPGKNSILKAKEGSKAKLKGIRFYINGEIFGDKKPNGEPTSDSEIKAIILNRIGMTPELFLMSVMTAQDADSNFLVATDTHKKEIISELLDLEVYESAYDQIKKDIDVQEKQIGQAEMQVEEINRESQAKDAETVTLQGKEKIFAEHIEKELAEVQSKFLKAENEYRGLKKAKPVVFDAVEVEAQLKAKESELAALPKEENALETEEIKVLEEQVLECEGLLRQLESDSSRLEGQNQLLSSELKKKTSKEPISAELETLKSLVPKDLDASKSNSLMDQILKANEKIAPIEAALVEQVSLLHSDESKINQLGGKLQAISAESAKKNLKSNNIRSEIEVILGAFKSTRVLDQGEVVLASLLSANALKMQSLERLANEIDFKGAQLRKEVNGLLSSENCPTCNREWDKEHQSERDQKVSGLTAQIKDLEANKAAAQADLKSETELKEEITTLIKVTSLKKTLAEVEIVEAQIKDLEVEKTALDKSIADRKNAIKALEQDKGEVSKLVQLATQEIEVLKNALAAQARIGVLTKDLESYLESESQIQGLQAMILTLSKKTAKIRVVSNNLSKRKNEELDRIRVKMRASQEMTTKLNQEIKDLTGRLAQAKMATQVLEQWETSVAASYERLESLLKQAEQIQARTNPYTELIEKVVERQDELKGRKSTITARIEKMQDELKYLNFWKNGFGPTGIRSFISDEVVVHLNEIVRDYLNDLFDGAISVVFESESISQKGGVSNKISTKFYLNGKESPLSLLSGGERQRIVLAVDLAISDIAESRTGTKINLKFMDEPFNGIDGNGQLKSIALFAKIANRKQGFFIITHDEKFQALCQNTIFVVKQDEISRVVSLDKFRDAG